jgi:hypothetical protein
MTAMKAVSICSVVACLQCILYSREKYRAFEQQQPRQQQEQLPEPEPSPALLR